MSHNNTVILSVAEFNQIERELAERDDLRAALTVALAALREVEWCDRRDVSRACIKRSRVALAHPAIVKAGL